MPKSAMPAFAALVLKKDREKAAIAAEANLVANHAASVGAAGGARRVLWVRSYKIVF